MNANQILHYFYNLVKDIEQMLEMENGHLLGDYEILAGSIKSRGPERICLLDLPDLCNDLETSLDRGIWTRTSQGFGSKLRGSIPSFLHSIFAMVFDPKTGELVDVVNPLAVRMLRQVLRGLKKYTIDCPELSKEKSIEKFRSIEYELVDPQLSWGDTDLVVRGRFPCLVDLVRRNLGRSDVREILTADYPGISDDELCSAAGFVQATCDRVLRGFKWDSRAFRPKHGPGAVAEQFKNSKYEFPTWPARLEQHFPYSEWGIPNYGLDSDWGIPCFSYIEGPAFDRETPAKLIAVPKDYKGPRLIASEPICSQFVQQGIMRVLRAGVSRSVLRHSIDFTSQEPSRDAALKASVDGSFSTIDLSSASDRLSCATVESCFRSSYWLLEKLNASRTTSILMPDGSALPLRKFAAQGAAFTFPVQSIVYALFSIGVLLYMNPTRRLADCAKEVRVFGDDMIVPKTSNDVLCALLTCVQLRVNPLKSFSNGLFRESCGMDAYAGNNVTPAYVRTFFVERQPATTESAVECANNLFFAGFINASRALLDSIPMRLRKQIAYVSSGSTVFGIRGSNSWSYRRRYNSNLQRFESLILAVESEVEKTTVDGPLRLMQWFVENPAPDSVWKSGEVVRVALRHRRIWVDSSLI